MLFYAFMPQGVYESSMTRKDPVKLTCYSDLTYGSLAIDIARSKAIVEASQTETTLNSFMFIRISIEKENTEFKIEKGNDCHILEGILTKNNHKPHSINELI